MTTTFIQPDYTFGNSKDCQDQMIGVLQNLDQALQALEPSPATDTVQFNDTIILTDGITSNTINHNGYSTLNTAINATHFLNFSDSSASGINSIKKTAGISCNPSTNTITATTFSGNAISAGSITLGSDNTSGTYYIPFSKTTAGTARLLYIDNTTGPLSYNPSTGTLSASAYTITGIPATVNTASTFGQVGLVYLQTLSGSITGSASSTDFNLTSCFNSTYQNYKIIFSTGQIAGSAYPSYALKAFLGTGTMPTTASLYGFEMTSLNTAVVSPVYSAGVSIATSPLFFAVSSIINKSIIFEVKNVGFLNTANNLVELLCKSIYSNPGITGSSDRTIVSTSVSGSTITGLTLQQTSINVGNNVNWTAIIYGYNTI